MGHLEELLGNRDAGDVAARGPRGDTVAAPRRRPVERAPSAELSEPISSELEGSMASVRKRMRELLQEK